MKTITKVIYLLILVVLAAVPIIVWAGSPAEIDLAGVGAFAAGLGVPLGALTAAMAAKSISRDRAASKASKGDES